MFRILVVCTANICRSPAGEVFLARKLASHAVEVHSAGTLAIDNHPADETIQEILQERGFPEIANHRSKALMPSVLNRYGLILCMENDHLAWVRRNEPGALGKTKLFGHWDGQKGVDDPIGRAKEAYAQALNTIETYSATWAEKIVALGLCS